METVQKGKRMLVFATGRAYSWRGKQPSPDRIFDLLQWQYYSLDTRQDCKVGVQSYCGCDLEERRK